MRYWLSLLLILAACDRPHPTMMGAVRHEVTIEGIRFVVFQKGSEAEVLRMGYLTRSQRGAVPALMVRAVAQTTGCRVIPDSLRTRIPGDTGEAMVDLDC
ncbi:hypothetical protein [Paracoccus tegillarcae]|uniref:Uncharacterized protein n=1 Tax=Paracoccus tegillarcae TaxID=1529068 RepID=A0A2K9EPR5_9RHOB|nr:hypothetical protein [Paracoccus tegillarcae]AUH35477.1 hypothetical protein CUV01_14800 [Paracoccus tegillarcae]